MFFNFKRKFKDEISAGNNKKVWCGASYFFEFIPYTEYGKYYK